MNCRSIVCVTVLSLAASAPLTAQGDEKLVRGRIVDPEGEAVAEATVATSWRFNRGGRLKPSSGSGRPLKDRQVSVAFGRDGKRRKTPPWHFGEGVSSDARGRFEGMFRIRWNTVLLTVYSKDRKLGAIVRLDPKQEDPDVTIRLRSTVRVKSTFSCRDLGRERVDPTGYLLLKAEPKRLMLGGCSFAKGTLDSRVPPGDYALLVYGRDMEHYYHPVKVGAGRPVLDLGTVDIPASFFAMYRGKKLPEWNVTAARGVPQDKSSIADFRGKWLIVEFWGFW